MTDGPRQEDWEAQAPPADFADRVMERVGRDSAAPRALRARAWGVAGAVAMAASIALAIGVRGGASSSHGEAIARTREQIDLGSRAVAVLERGARVAWDGDEVTQPAGDVFYRVEPGGAFRVHTPAGDVEVLGTCFRVVVSPPSGGGAQQRTEGDVNARDIKAGAIGAALTATAFVSVYEGKVAVSRASDRVTLTAGESATSDATGVHRGAAKGADGASAADDNAAASADEADPLAKANANLADSVREYKQRLEAIEAQKKGVEKQLAEAQEKLAIAQNDGQAPPKKSDFDLTQDDWKRLAQEGKVNAHFPCVGPSAKNRDEISDDSLQKAGLAPQDRSILQSAYDASRKRVWQGTIRPLCIKAVKGDAALADRLGPGTCQSLIQDVAAQNGEDVEEEMHEVAEIRAGMRPMPADGGGDVLKMMLALSLESGAVEQDLAKSLGPDEAHRVVFVDEVGCWNNSSWGVGPRPTLPGK